MASVLKCVSGHETWTEPAIAQGISGSRIDCLRARYRVSGTCRGTHADTLITASGNLNQWLFIAPRHDLVVVVTGAANQASVPDFVIREILPSVLR